MKKGIIIEKQIIKIVLTLISIILTQDTVYAAIIGVSPSSMTFSDVLRGGYAERSFFISTDSSDLVEISLESYGEISEWINFSRQNFTISKDSPGTVIVSINPFLDAPNGNYSGLARITSSSFGEGQEGKAVGKVRTYLDLLINVQITDREIISCEVSSWDIHSVEKGDDIVLELNFLNLGNVRLKPRVSTVIWDVEKINVLYEDEFIKEQVFPTKDSFLQIRIPSSNFAFGQYWIEVTAPDCYESELLTFDILEEGTLTAKGTLLGIVNQKFANVSETVPINAKFKNIGEKELDAQFSGKITLGNEIIKILESPREKVAVGDEHSFDFYFIPEKEGTYVISGIVLYNGKRTFESSSTLKALENKFAFKKIFFVIVYLVLFLLIVIFLYKIKKEREKYKRRLRNLR